MSIDLKNFNTQSTPHNQDRTNYGDLIIVVENRDSVKFIISEKDKIIQNKYGDLKHDDIYNQIPGTKIKSMKGDAYITILSFLSHLSERCINRLVQILFNPDISLIITFLNKKTTQ